MFAPPAFDTVPIMCICIPYMVGGVQPKGKSILGKLSSVPSYWKLNYIPANHYTLKHICNLNFDGPSQSEACIQRKFPFQFLACKILVADMLYSTHKIYLYPLHPSPLSLFASSSVAYLPFFSFLPSLGSSPIISSLSPLSRVLFSLWMKNI